MSDQDILWLKNILVLLAWVLGWAVREAMQPPMSAKVQLRGHYRVYTEWTDYAYLFPRLVGLSLVRKFQRRLKVSTSVPRYRPDLDRPYIIEYRAHPSQWFKIHNK